MQKEEPDPRGEVSSFSRGQGSIWVLISPKHQPQIAPEEKLTGGQGSKSRIPDWKPEAFPWVI